ncbi:hypothetical protein ACHAQJ_006331 [Trichoderma viride]
MSEFELFSETGKGTWLAVKKNDYRGVKYIAQPLGILDGSDVQGADKQDTVNTVVAFYNLMYNLNQGPAIAQILNHENIISIAGHIRTNSVVGSVSAAENPDLTQPKDYIVWDFCDAANLSALFQSKPFVSSDFYLPESLCWHVLTSLLNAITYLHDGKRLFLDTKAPPGEERKWMSVDQDWNPILHRAIEPRNIFFQHPRGIETYGLCKLGNFEHAVVTNHVITPGDTADAVEENADISRAMAPYRGLETLDMTRHQLLKSVEAYTADNYPYTVANELFSIGTVIFTMMTGRKPLFYCEKYSCCHITSSSLDLQGCKTMPHDQQCTHLHQRLRHPDCHEPTINTDNYLAKAQYSEGLRRVIKELLAFHPGSKAQIAKILPLTKLVMEYYWDWKFDSEEGMRYKDIEDDMTARYLAETEKRS